MTNGKHEEHNPKRRPIRPASGLGQQGIDLIRSMQTQTQRSNEPLEDYGLDLLAGGPSNKRDDWEEDEEGYVYEPPMIQRDEDGSILDHSSLLPSQHSTGSGYGY